MASSFLGSIFSTCASSAIEFALNVSTLDVSYIQPGPQTIHAHGIRHEEGFRVLISPGFQGNHLECREQVSLTLIVESLQSVDRDTIVVAQTTASGLAARVSIILQCMPSKDPAVSAPSPRAISRLAPRLYLRPGAIKGRSTVRCQHISRAFLGCLRNHHNPA